MEVRKIQLEIASDHAGYVFKEEIKKNLQLHPEYMLTDEGPLSADPVDYPDYAHPVAKKVNEGKADYGILICGSGNGVAMTANKYSNVRAALCWQEEIALLARKHNNANIICIPARFCELSIAKKMIHLFLSTSFEGGRHQKRIDKISC